MEKGLQYRRTDRAIMNAFIKLVNQGSFEKLTVQEILDEALVSRNTFYAHYRDKYDIAEQLFKKYKEDFLRLLKNLIQISERNGQAPVSSKNFPIFLPACFFSSVRNIRISFMHSIRSKQIK